MAVPSWEFWESPDRLETSFFPTSSEQARRHALDAGMTCTWVTEAEGHNPAMRLLYEHLGWGEYKPMLQDDGTPHPEDEDGDIRQRSENAYSSTWSVVCPTTGDRVSLAQNPTSEDFERGSFDWECRSCEQLHRMEFRRPKDERSS